MRRAACALVVAMLSAASASAAEEGRRRADDPILQQIEEADDALFRAATVQCDLRDHARLKAAAEDLQALALAFGKTVGGVPFTGAWIVEGADCDRRSLERDMTTARAHLREGWRILRRREKAG